MIRDKLGSIGMKALELGERAYGYFYRLGARLREDESETEDSLHSEFRARTTLTLVKPDGTRGRTFYSNGLEARGDRITRY